MKGNYMVNWNDGSGGCGAALGKVFLMFVIVFVSATLLTMNVRAAEPSFNHDQIEFLAGKAVGESSTDPYAVACIMRTRLEGGWSPKLVHTAFYARWVPPSIEQAETIWKILQGEGDCNKDAWYQWSYADALLIQPREDCFLFESGGNKFYSKCALWR